MAKHDVDAENIIGSAIGYNARVNNYYNQPAKFDKLENLEDYQPPKFPKPQNVDSSIEDLFNRNYGVLILGGEHEDKKDLALYFACKLGTTVLEWVKNESSQSLLAEIRRKGTDTGKKVPNNNKVFFLSNLSPQWINNEIQDLLEAAKKGENYIVATTNAAELSDSKYLFWNTSDKTPKYKPQELASALIEKLKCENKLSNETELEKHIREAVEKKLETYTEVKNCFYSLCNKELIAEQMVDDAIDNVLKDKEISLKQRFDNLLPPKKLLLIGLSLFDGLLEEQFFVALEIVVKEVWQQRDPTLVALDYQDLEDLRNYYNSPPVTDYDRDSDGFKFFNAENYPIKFAINKIEIRNSDRPRLLKIAWKTHRRQIINALEVIVSIVKESVEQKYGNWELYGDDFRQSLLHNTVSQTLSDIGAGEASAASEVRNPLLKLASYPKFEVKDVAAKAIARWYINYSSEQSQRKIFFATLIYFWSIATEKQEDASEIKELRENIGATVAMTISYAAINASSSKEFKDDFLNWLKELSTHPSRIVREHFGYHTLSYIVPIYIYLDELKESLKEWTQKYEELNHPIAVALARAHKEKPQEVKDLLEKWYNEAKQNMPEDKSDTQNERLLATVALTYGEIDYEKQ